ESRPSAVFFSVSARNSLRTDTSSSLWIAFIVDIAAPSFCTSRGPRYFMTSAASSAPSASISTAPLCTPLSVISHPCLHDVCDDLRILARERLGRFQVLLVGVLLHAHRAEILLDFLYLLRAFAGRFIGQRQRRRIQLVEHRLQYLTVQ